jgi:hypothetical protein
LNLSNEYNGHAFCFCTLALGFQNTACQESESVSHKTAGAASIRASVDRKTINSGGGGETEDLISGDAHLVIRF